MASQKSWLLKFLSIICLFQALVMFSWLYQLQKNRVNSFIHPTLHIRTTSRSSILILYWTRVFNSTVNATMGKQHKWPFFSLDGKCPVKCFLSSDKRRAYEASALVIHGRNTDEMPLKSLKHIPWIFHVNESPRFTTALKDQSIMAHFNFSATYRLDSDFPCPEFIRPNLTRPLSFLQKTGLVMAMFSHCESTRSLYTLRMMKYIQVDSYGKCLRNKLRIPRDSKGRALKTMSMYKFTLVFPNSDCEYYMTEKIHEALSVGTVPVWMGTNKIDEVLKWGNLNHSIVKVSNFKTPKRLANHLLWLAENEEEYNKYLKWKFEGFNFPLEFYNSSIGQWWYGSPLYCRVCMRLAQDPRGHFGLPVDKCDGKQRRTLEKWIRE